MNFPCFDTFEEQEDWLERQRPKPYTQHVGKPKPSYTQHVGKPLESYTPRVGKPPTRASELVAARKPTEWVVDQFGASGACVLLAAEMGSGKTSLLYQMAAAIAGGETFMGQLPTKRGRVLIVQADESETNAADKLALMGLDIDGIDFRFAEEQNGWHTLDVGRLEAEVKAGKYAAVFLDSVTTLLTNTGHSMRDPEFARPLYDLNRLASSQGLFVAITAHLRKPETGTRTVVTMHDILGAGTQAGAVSDVWGLWRAKEPQHEDHYVLSCLGKRNCEAGTAWNLQGSREDFSWRLVSVGGSDVLPQRRLELAAQIMHVVHSSEEERGYRELAGLVGCNPEHCRRVCTDLFLAGEISRRKLPQGNGRPLWVYGPGGFPT